jgi:AraC family transcriptional regulator
MAQLEMSIKHIKPIKVACIDCKGPYNEMGANFQELIAWVMKNRVETADVPGIALEMDDPFQVGPANCRYTVCIPIKGSPMASGRVKIETLPEIDAACALHKGSYSGLPQKWQEAMGWIAGNKYEVANIPREVYLNDCGQTPEGELLTELQIPIKK